MQRYLIVLALAVVAAVFGPDLLQRHLGLNERGSEDRTASTTDADKPQKQMSKTIVLKADGRGHFVASIRINGKPSEALVDTGATFVAMPMKLARRSGINVAPNDFTADAETANGRIKFAPVTIDRLDVAGVRIRNVQAGVVPDDALSTVLLGMSAVSRLGTVELKDGSLVIRHPR
ncbi:TIGR02281 family clan AA aspartic protease [Pseudovibrio exalbescens]|uniref:retropepsin-like aspartic protease family protein n=1 Tax=Pseudovibrio exalbescens TaxID=197461 RepID=UPI002366A19C|nr:TIGR02281 family clan AA aspartic protease [Pseudovibrio exalbescens]MDD7910069.1 TIGR02281 family clan AA aspartic protease [Pseudovibrio exalbescens]